MRTHTKPFLAALCGLLLLSLTGCGSSASESDPAQNTASQETSSMDNTLQTDAMDFDATMDGISTGSILANRSVHDPSVLQVGETYYIFGSHMTAAKTTDLLSWLNVGDGYNSQNPVYKELYSSKDVFRYAGKAGSVVPTDDKKCHFWAPDVIYNKTMGCYCMYYCASSTWNCSTLGFATSDNPEGPYVWAGDLIYSGITNDTLAQTDVLSYVSEDYARSHYIKKDGSYDFDHYPNALDPTVFYDEDERLWMVYGSWSGGIFLIELDPATGQVIHPEADEENHVDPYFGKWLLGGYHHSIEGPYILYDKEAGYYYLYVSYGGLARTGGYQIRCYRSKTVDGLYVDMNGKGETCADRMDHAPYGLKLSGNYMLPSLTCAYMATGHNSAFIDETTGKRYLVYHTRFDQGTETHYPRVKEYLLNEENWPCLLPYEPIQTTADTEIADAASVAGRYYMIDQGLSIDARIAQPSILYLLEDGSAVMEQSSGTWSYTEGTNYISITLEGKIYKGVVSKQKDLAGTPVKVFSAVGENKSIWGVCYE